MSGFVKSYRALISVRFFLGMFEGGLVGGILVYLALFYRRHQLLYRIGMFGCSAPLAVAFGGLLATGLSKIKHGGYNGVSSACHLWGLLLTSSLQVGHGFSSLREL